MVEHWEPFPYIHINMPTESALYQLSGRIEKALDAKEYALGLVFFDIEWACDTGRCAKNALSGSPLDRCTIPDTSVFKNMLKTFLFKLAFNIQ